MLSGEGLVVDLTGPMMIYTQSRSPEGVPRVADPEAAPGRPATDGWGRGQRLIGGPADSGRRCWGFPCPELPNVALSGHGRCSGHPLSRWTRGCRDPGERR